MKLENKTRKVRIVTGDAGMFALGGTGVNSKGEFQRGVVDIPLDKIPSLAADLAHLAHANAIGLTADAPEEDRALWSDLLASNPKQV